ncbi:MAG: FAD-binding oxidoreductase [Paracoccaceae bacterium]|nr:FAD-binding oxidoreductase [Paracoccaceae bacterium]
MPMISEQTPVAFSAELPETVDVAIIGAGIAGTATAFFLAQQGAKVLLLEKGRVAGEQSSRNWGWIRQQGRDRSELPIMIESNRLWRGFAERTGEADLTFSECGCLYVAESPAAMAKYETWHDLARQHQLGTKLLSVAELRERLPDLPYGYAGGMITPSDGRGEPFVAVPALARAAERSGAIIVESCAARALDVETGRVAGIVTEKGRVRTERVLLAGGAWSNAFAANAGLDLPQLTVRSTAARTEPAPHAYDMNISQPGLSLRRRADGGYTLATGDVNEHYLSPNSFRYLTKFLKLVRLSARDLRLKPAAPKGFPGSWATPRRWSGDQISPFERMRVLNPDPSPAVVRRIEARLGQRYPALMGVKLAEAWAGMIDVTPDAVPVLGESHDLPGLFLATGLSGHGFGIGPGIGRVMADVLLGRDPGHDLTRFRPSRFTDGSEIVPGPY